MTDTQLSRLTRIPVAIVHELGFPLDRIRVHGGAIRHGHPRPERHAFFRVVVVLVILEGPMPPRLYF